ncbi:hypothetical protein BBJ28_00012698 [Nothophytophthora sp. Chile5]|nr:hypothetical protein BBJ28_00012698 [Nothophytophthora sp. Chile5]
MAPPTSMTPPTSGNEPRYKLALRVYSAEELLHSSSQGAYCKLYLGDTPMMDGSHKALSKKDSSDSTTSEGDAVADELPPAFQVMRTRTQHQQPNALAPPETIWDESFEVPVRPGVELATQILSIRVKSQHLFFCPVIGACAVSLANLCPGERLEQWFPLHKGKKPAGRIRVVLLIAPEDKPLRAAQISDAAKRNRANLDVMAARAASHEADEAIKRLVDKQLRQEAERRQRRLNRTASGPVVDVKRPSEAINQSENNNRLQDRKLDDVVARRSNLKLPTPHSGISAIPATQSSPKILPPLGIPAALRENNPNESNQLVESLNPMSPISEYERRLDGKLRQVRKETARLRKLKAQLKKYIPDLQSDSDSDDESLDSEEEGGLSPLSSASSSSTTSSASERQQAAQSKQRQHQHKEQKPSRAKATSREGKKLRQDAQAVTYSC